MAAIAHSPSFAKKVGIPQSVGSDFVKADKGKTFSKGGTTMASKMNPGFAAMMAKKKATFEKSGKDVEKNGMKEGSKADMALDEKQMGMKRGGLTKMAKGGCAMAIGGIAKANLAKGDISGKLFKSSAGEGIENYQADTKFVKQREGDGVAKRGLTKIGRSKEMFNGGFTKAADGVAQKGKTKAKRFADGGMMGGLPTQGPMSSDKVAQMAALKMPQSATPAPSATNNRTMAMPPAIARHIQMVQSPDLNKPMPPAMARHADHRHRPLGGKNLSGPTIDEMPIRPMPSNPMPSKPAMLGPSAINGIIAARRSSPEAFAAYEKEIPRANMPKYTGSTNLSGPMKKGGSIKAYAKGGSVSSASSRADGCATKGKTKCKYI
jgi:hypothetical protein